MKNLAIFGRLISLIAILVGLLLLLSYPFISFVIIIVSIIVWNICGYSLKKLYSQEIDINNNINDIYSNTLFETDEWKKREQTTRRFNEFQKELENVSKKYYDGIKQIESGWSLIYNLNDYNGMQAEQFEHLCLENITLYKEMCLINKNYGEKSPPNAPAFKRLAMLYEKRGQYEQSISICIDALQHGACGDKMQSRLCRMIKRAERTPTPQEQTLLR